MPSARCWALLRHRRLLRQSLTICSSRFVDGTGAPLNGRLLLFLKAGSGDKSVDTNNFSPSDTWIAAREIHDLQPGASVEVDTDATAFPHGFSAIAPGTYQIQAVLDPDHIYPYGGRALSEWESPVIALTNWTPDSGDEPTLTLDHHPAESPVRAAAIAKIQAAATPDVARLEEFESPSLTRFWGRPTNIRAWVILPPGYNEHAPKTYPAVYWTHGFGGNLEYALYEGITVAHQRTVAGKIPPMIWVMLDESIPQGTHEFADSINNGTWGSALTREFIPWLEHKYKMDARANGRFLNGHSSGGWATLQLEVNYPDVFGGTWSTSPDPSDFHDFTGTDLYAVNANIYHGADGKPTPLIRDHDKVLGTAEVFSREEAVLGPYGGQMTSFDWAFSPKGPDGAPLPMFDRQTGTVDPAVVAYWRDHYDLAHIVETPWAEKKTQLKGRIHLYVGTADTFYLDGAAHKFDAVLAKLNADGHFTYIPNRTHFDLYNVGDDPNGLFDEITAQMYAVARPGVAWHKK